ncbi:MAG TPA: DUF3426 domain-containing protein [Rhizomicrobium sp.]|nr:DUF3426 domain-containing protein [Rhizomicrobium sp.]
MILTCPECATRYQTDASHFSPDGRKVRCAKCGHVWFQAAPAIEAEAPIDSAPAMARPAVPSVAVPQRAPAPQESPSWQAPPQERAWPLERLGLGLGWAALALVVLAMGWSTVHYRENIATLWPQSSSLYRAMGLSVNARGIEIQSDDKNAHFETEDGQDVLVITGQLTNISSHELSVPQISVSLTDATRRELYHWSFAPGVATLHAGQSAPFHTRLPNPPVATKHISLRFAERSN